ncbi:MAG: hypothetical protein A2821_03235 [Candidatus Magasanikbacteria bacterium RIFCSPHIGHO2_01_FULL_41_23]|uniref:Uncharacterized protein n=1 Tax=Candidatus Magasanikbacteria bacterium RIFCSPLOWO2_01_FULL_40_15 TaxID=1798686 RepID=A0A1F6N1U0_9BACT|nr:MAG: hypothetical protein A2821_03235 [Candidatus Magasanikbacteria bacterium RIFCSPHIGHO2_01_FULL_41_23]OGH76469.1 MAG: hypothetical protein A3F22_03225 [Candidatus Magasanikbacteria bacterium RIFCSPHIGHO2_12_FULL_41_16]OGH77955.1 MAG: hypothetical protein A2983_01260 [Candidatus Magasanikbacteria bacterium RIFCSPLOWO2_01_FULL_40_15]
MSSVVKNTVFILFGSIGQKIISLAYFTFLVRMLGKDLTGDYTAALALSTLFVVFIDLGLTNVLIRNGAQNQSNLSQSISNIFAIKILTSIIAYTAMMIFSFNKFDAAFSLLVAASGITMILDSVHLTLYGYLRALGKLNYEAVGMIMSQTITLILGTSFLLLRWPILTLILAFTVASAINVIYSFYQAKKSGFVFKRPETTERLRLVLWSALPFTTAIILGRFYSYADIIILKIIKGSGEVGVYSTPSKISFAFQFIPLAFTAALYPHLSELAKNNTAQFRLVLTNSIRYLLLISAPISLGIFILAKPIVLLAFTEKFIASVAPLKIMILSLIFSFVSFPLGAALNACGAEKKQTAIVAVALIINLIGNAFLIPKLGAMGAAFSALIGNCILGVAGFWFLPSDFRPHLNILIKTALSLGIAVFLMSISVIYTQATLQNLFLSMIVGGAVFISLAFTLGLIAKKDLIYLKSAFGKTKIV